MRIAALVVLAVAIGVAAASAPVDPVEQQFRAWMQQHAPRSYRASPDDSEYPVRLAAFRATVARVAERNAAAVARGSTVRFGLNRFSDWTADEFRTRLLTFRADVSALKGDGDGDTDAAVAVMPELPLTDVDVVTAADRFPRGSDHPHDVSGVRAWDWRSKGAVTPVKDQGQCGSCWAFSAVETTESFWFLGPNASLPVLSPQQVVDCDIFPTDNGCNGGTTQFAYQYVIGAGGLDTEQAYPYTSGDDGDRGFCMFDKAQAAARVASWSYATPVCADLACAHQNETRMATALVAHGPVSVCLNADAWQDYESGVMDAAACGSSGLLDLDHCVQAVGFTRSATNSSDSYWIVRNSWNMSWGLAGYIYLAMDTNTCGIANIATQIVPAPWD